MSGCSHLEKPNFLFFIVDQERYPTVYENEELRAWREENLIAHELLRENGFEFHNHYIGSAACVPSRATLYTGQYPSLHGVTQTPGVAKSSFDADMFWLDPNTVPTMGEYFREGGYLTFWKGKWHVSTADIIIPGTKKSLPSYDSLGFSDARQVEWYLNSNRLDEFGFSGWVGPEPEGKDARNSASSAAVGLSGRDAVYAAEVVDLIKDLDRKRKQEEIAPWFIVSSFLNPHDIALYGFLTARGPLFNFEVDPSVPYIPPAPTAKESLATKPSAQESYRNVYQQALQPLIDTPFYRRLYLSLQKKVDKEMVKVFQALRASSFYENTIVCFVSDHGELLGAHGGQFQKWYDAYEETIHVPCIIHSPKLFSGRQGTDMLTSHVDILPTLLDLAGIDVAKVREKLVRNHTEVRPFVGRSLVPLLTDKTNFIRANEPVYFFTEDDITKGPNQVGPLGKPYTSVVEPNSVETVITKLKTGVDQGEQLWKLSRYSDDLNETSHSDDEFEMYNLTLDPLEEKNLAHPQFQTSEGRVLFQILHSSLREQRAQKRLLPRNP